MSKVHFETMVQNALTQTQQPHMRPVIEKELLHYDILFALDNENLLDMLTFQGGTALRLCYGAQRFSEDLDFAGGRNFHAKELGAIKDCLETYLTQRYGLEIHVKEPKPMLDPNKHVPVYKWQLSITTSPEKKDLPKQRIKLEVANVPAYTREPRTLMRNYNFLPDGYSDTIVLTESLNEIMADKLIAFVCTTNRIRHRDIWDLHWLQERGAAVDVKLVQQKIHDYHAINYDAHLKERLAHLPAIFKSQGLSDELSRFLPMDAQARTLKKEKFLLLLAHETEKMLVQVQRELFH